MMLSNIIANEPINPAQLRQAAQIILALQEELKTRIVKGSGPFLAAIYDEKGNLIAKAANSVVHENCSHCHAEMNAIRLAEEKLHTYDLAPHRLALYVTTEPCLMCLGGIMWSGIRQIYYGVPSKRVEEITGFDEGFKPNWQDEFKKRGITVYGNIEPQVGEEVLAAYVAKGHKIYRPSR
ncbi:MAG: nucleoside deaminase [Elusimicrobiaceae bacterium]|nr:nucleoside deaminase [Elusimicrobiaceae bacterium]